MTVLDVIQRSTEFLEKKAVESPRLQAELLLAHLLKLPRMQLYLNFERALTPSEVTASRELVRRRGQREPLQYIVGSTCFCGVEIEVNRHVLIPRPETELLAERGWTFLHQLSKSSVRSNGNYPATALDFGTGSGCLAITLAAQCPEAQIHALEISSDAIALARQNAEHHAVAERIHFFTADTLRALRADSAFDLIISNPPYIPTAEIDSLEPEVRDHEPRGALDGGFDGLDFFRRLAHEARCFLKPGGRLMLEFGDGQAPAIREIFESEKWIVEAIQKDYNQHPRIIVIQPE